MASFHRPTAPLPHCPTAPLPHCLDGDSLGKERIGCILIGRGQGRQGDRGDQSQPHTTTDSQAGPERARLSRFTDEHTGAAGCGVHHRIATTAQSAVAAPTHAKPCRTTPDARYDNSRRNSGNRSAVHDHPHNQGEQCRRCSLDAASQTQRRSEVEQVREAMAYVAKQQCVRA
jgi:hypothetical protein